MKTMMKTLFVLAAAALSQTSFAGEPGKLHVTGKLAGTSDTIQVLVVDMQARQYGDQKKVATRDGAFDFTVNVKEPTQAMIMNLKDGKPAGRLAICAVPGEDCEITGSWDGEYFLNGSSFYKNYNDMDRALTPVNNEQSEFMEKCNKMLTDGISRDSVMAFYNSKIGDIVKKVEAARIAYIKANPNNEACATLISEFDADKVYEVYNLLSENVRNGRMAAFMKPTLANADRELARREQAKNIAQGKPAPEITLNDINGKPLSLSSLRGKYVVLDFWGSWCGWCIKGFPEMKNYYNKYKGKLEILGIDCNDTEAKWKDAVKKYELPWLHVYNPRTSDVATKYAIEGYPTKIVVDPKGNIAKVVIGEDPAFYTYLDELFK